MTGYSDKDDGEELFAINEFDIASLDDEIRVDRTCQQQLRRFYLDRIEKGTAAEEAGALANGADYFLRDFVIADRRENIFAIAPERVRQFAGNWYISNTLEPNLKELQGILRGVAAFFEYACRIGRVDAAAAAAIGDEAARLEFYRRRIDDFWAIEADGYEDWRKGCPVTD